MLLNKGVINVVVLSAGAGPAVSLIKALKRQTTLNIRVFAYASDIDSAGLYLSDDYRIIPRIDSEDYFDQMINFFIKDKIDFAFPILDKEVDLLSKKISDVNSLTNTQVFINPQKVVDRTINKMKSYNFNLQNHILTPAHYSFLDLKTQKPPGRILMKPKIGVGAKDQLIFSTYEEVTGEYNRDELMFCEFIDGQEFSIDGLNLGSNDFLTVPRLRREIRSGQMVKGITSNNQQLITTANSILTAYGITDVACLQLIQCENKLYFVELNPRYGTGISLSIASGPNFPILQIMKALGIPILQSEKAFKPNLAVTRYWEEAYYSV